MIIRFILLMLVMILIAFGRYKAENHVQAIRIEIDDLEARKQTAAQDIMLMRAEIAYLESPARLASIAGSVTELKPLAGRQLITADEFLVAFGNGQASEGVMQTTEQSAEQDGNRKPVRPKMPVAVAGVDTPL